MTALLMAALLVPVLAGATRPTPPVPAERIEASADSVQLRRELERLISLHRGTVGVSVRNLATGEATAIRGAETFPTQSTIKVSLLVALLDEANKGRVRLDERTVGAKMEALGLPHSKIHSKTFRRETSISPDSSRLYGLGVTTPDEMVELFALLYAGRAVSPPLDSLALRMLAANQDDAMMTRWLPGNVRVANKTGTGEDSRIDCGLIYSPAAPLSVCVMTKGNEDTSYAVDNAAHLLIGQIARTVFSHYNPSVALPPLPR